MSFWDELIDKKPTSGKFFDSTTEALRGEAKNIPSYPEMIEYLQIGLEHIVNNYTEGEVDYEHMRVDGSEMTTAKGTDMCEIVNDAMVEIVDDELMVRFSMAMARFRDSDNPDHVLDELKDLLHYVMHMAMGLGIGMAVVGETLFEDEED